MRCKHDPHPDYRELWDLKLDITGKDQEAMASLRKFLWAYELPENMKMWDEEVVDPEGGMIPVRIYANRELVPGTPVVMNIHGGGFTTGNLDNDNARCIAIADMVPCIVVSVEYTLVPDAVYPRQLNQCLAVLNWIYENADQLGGDKERIGLFGTSAGGNLAAALALYVRDFGGPRISMVGLNVPGVDGKLYESVYQNWDSPIIQGKNMVVRQKMEYRYEGNLNGNPAPYYVHPNHCENLSGFPSTFLIAAEYDPLRDGIINFASHLLHCNVCCELHVLPKVPHGFDMKNAEMTKWIRLGLAAAYRREFGM